MEDQDFEIFIANDEVNLLTFFINKNAHLFDLNLFAVFKFISMSLTLVLFSDLGD